MVWSRRRRNICLLSTPHRACTTPRSPPRHLRPGPTGGRYPAPWRKRRSPGASWGRWSTPCRARRCTGTSRSRVVTRRRCRLEAPLKDTYGEARRQREQLIASAKDLAGSDVAARDVVDKVRRLQAQWQAVAKAMPLPRRDEGTLWTAFKTATDAIFAARDAGRAAKDAEFSTRIKAREDIIERLAALPSSSAAPAIKRAMAEADTAWRACAELPKPQASRLDARYRAAREAATKRLGEIAARASQARFDALIGMMELCREREAAEDSGRVLTEEQASELEARWKAVEDIPESWKARLEARFRGTGLSQAASASSVPQPGSSVNKRSGKTAGESSGESLPDTLLNLEIACGVDSPAEFLAARQQLKLRALKTAMEGRQAAVTTPADIERWLLDAASTPRPDEVSLERMRKIIAAVRVRLGSTAKAPRRQESK